MLSRLPVALSSAAETRRRELPASIALVVLIGGVAAAIAGGSAPVAWAAVVALALIADSEIYRRLDAGEAKLEGRIEAGLAAWALAGSSIFALLPLGLWLGGTPAGAAAAMVLWVVAIVRQFSPGFSGSAMVAVAGAAPPALMLLAAPLLSADWDVAAIAMLGGGALMAYVIHARAAADAQQRTLTDTAGATDTQNALARMMLDNEDNAVVLLDREDRIVASSRAVQLRSGGMADVRGMKFSDLVPLAREVWQDAFTRALSGEDVRHKEHEIMIAGRRRYYDWEARPWRDDDGAICGVYASGRDITSLVEARKEAAEDQDRLRVALEAGLSVVWEVDYKDKAVRWYGDRVAVFGVEDFTFEQFHTTTTKVIHPDDREMIRKYFVDIAMGATHSVEHRILKADGTIAWLQSWARRVLGRSGGVRKFVVMSKDITDRKLQEAAFIAAMQRAEATLRAKRALFQDVGEIAPEKEATIAHADVSVNDMFEHLAALMEEMNARDEVLAEALANLRAAREAADTANVSKSQFLTSMSHELRTPLNAIIGYSEILREEAEADARETDIADIDRVLAAARHLLHLINDILDLSKIEAGRMDVSASAFEIADMIREAAATVLPSVEKNANKLRLEIDNHLGEAINDAFKINQCLLNLLANAAKFTNAGDITVTARREKVAAGDWIEIAVSDTGIGMTEEQLSRLFNAFTQAEATTANRYGGTGLGLAITRRMMQLLGGDVSVKSAPGVGSTFTLRFPAALAIEPTPARTQAGAAQGQGHQRLVLLIDDEESARDLTTRALTRLGFEVRTAVTGREGVEMARALEPSLVLLDINLPDMTGWDVLDILLTVDAGDMPIIVHSVDDNRQRALTAGACEHLVKPADRDVLAAAALRFARAPEISQPAAKPAITLQAKLA